VIERSPNLARPASRAGLLGSTPIAESGPPARSGGGPSNASQARVRWLEHGPTAAEVEAFTRRITT
jgi:hypothetical protein